MWCGVVCCVAQVSSLSKQLPPVSEAGGSPPSPLQGAVKEKAKNALLSFASQVCVPVSRSVLLLLCVLLPPPPPPPLSSPLPFLLMPAPPGPPPHPVILPFLSRVTRKNAGVVEMLVRDPGARCDCAGVEALLVGVCVTASRDMRAARASPAVLPCGTQVKPAMAAEGKGSAPGSLLTKMGGAWRSKSRGMGEKSTGVSLDGARVRRGRISALGICACDRVCCRCP